MHNTHPNFNSIHKHLHNHKMMNSITKITFFLTLSILSTFAYAVPSYPDSIHHTTIVLTNKFPTATTIECKSKRDDRGVHTVAPGQSYSFDITFESADLYMFFCDIQPVGVTGVFDIYDSSRDITRCPGTCNWDVAANGVSGYREGSSTADIVFKW